MDPTAAHPLGSGGSGVVIELPCCGAPFALDGSGLSLWTLRDNGEVGWQVAHVELVEEGPIARPPGCLRRRLKVSASPARQR